MKKRGGGVQNTSDQTAEPAKPNLPAQPVKPNSTVQSTSNAQANKVAVPEKKSWISWLTGGSRRRKSRRRKTRRKRP